jgi:DNA-binding CsgD family transcriptional regulator
MVCRWDTIRSGLSGARVGGKVPNLLDRWENGMDPDRLVGRGSERSALAGQLASALAGRGSVAVVAGDSGAGKTALVRSLCRDAEQQGAAVLVGRCYDVSLPPLYGPWIDLFSGEQADGAVPRPAAFARQGTLATSTRQTALIEDVRGVLRESTAHRPVILVLEDMQWADLASCELLRQVARDAATHPIMIIITVSEDVLNRSCPLYRLLPPIERETEATHIALPPLSPEEIQRLVAGSYRMRPADTMRLAAYLHEMTRGNALFVTELLGALAEQGLIRPSGDRHALSDLDHTGLPLRLRQVIDNRLAGLSEETRRQLATAAVVGPDVPFALWAEVFGADEESMLQVVEEAADAGLIEPASDGAAFRFVHALVHEALYESVFPVRRRVMHRKIAEALAARPVPDPDSVARHFHDAADDRAGEWLVRAGQRAELAGAQLTAVERYEAALHPLEQAGASSADRAWVLLGIALLRRMDDSWRALSHVDTAFRLAADAGDAVLSARVLLGRGLVRCYAGIIEDGLADLLAGLDAIGALPAEPVHRFRGAVVNTLLNWGTAAYWLAIAGHPAEAAALAGERLRGAVPASGAGPVAATAGAYSGLGYVHAMQGRPAEARLAYTRAAAGFRKVDEHRLAFIALRDELVHVTLAYHPDDHAERARLAAELRSLGERGNAVRAFVDVSVDNIRYPLLQLMVVAGRWAELRQVADTIGDYGVPILRHVVAGVLAAVCRAQGDADRAWRLVRETWPAGPATAPGSREPYHTLDQQRLAVQLALDDHDLLSARAWLEAHDRWLAWSGFVLGRAAARCLWARYDQAQGCRPLAVRSAEEALRLATAPRQPLVLLDAHRLLGELTSDAAHFDAALELAEACDAPYERALTLLSRAELSLPGDDPAELAGQAEALFEPLAARPALDRVNRLRDRLAREQPVNISYPAGLTEREAEVLGLLARGLSDKEIAVALQLSPRTVGRHVEKAYRKVGAHRRAEATVFALRHGLIRGE